MNDVIGSITSSLPSKTVQPAALDTFTLPRQPYDGFDAGRFSQLMASQRPVVPATASVTSAPSASPSVGDALGDKMLAHMSSLGSDFQKTWQQVADVVAAPDNVVSMQDMLKAQMHLVRVSGEYEVIGKVIGKSTQNVDQMLHMQ